MKELHPFGDWELWCFHDDVEDAGNKIGWDKEVFVSIETPQGVFTGKVIGVTTPYNNTLLIKAKTSTEGEDV